MDMMGFGYRLYPSYKNYNPLQGTNPNIDAGRDCVGVIRHPNRW